MSHGTALRVAKNLGQNALFLAIWHFLGPTNAQKGQKLTKFKDFLKSDLFSQPLIFFSRVFCLNEFGYLHSISWSACVPEIIEIEEMKRKVQLIMPVTKTLPVSTVHLYSPC